MDQSQTAGAEGRARRPLRIVIPGGSGQVGTMLARAYRHDGHDVVVLSREPRQSGQSRPSMTRPWRVVPWDGVTMGAWAHELDGCDVVINLAGRSVDCRYTPSNRREILDSRVLSTRVVGQAIADARHPPRVWLQASTATIYEHRYDPPNDEATGVIGGSEANAPGSWTFSIDVARAWERACVEAMTPGTRTVLLRSAMTMSPDSGGVFDTLLRLARFGLGGRVGDGRQFMSWIHEDDFIRATQWLIEHERIDGVVNLAAPAPVPQAEFMRALRAAAGMPIGLPATTWMLEAAAFFLRTESELILKSRRVVPGRLIEDGFEFRFPTWPEAAVDLVRRWRSH